MASDILLIDSDMLLYRKVVESQTQLDGDKDSFTATFAVTYYNIEVELLKRELALDDDCIIHCWTDDVNFRKSICSKYKAKRGPKPHGYRKAKENLMTKQSNHFMLPCLEADDLLSMYGWMAHRQGKTAFVFSGDKDTRQIPGNKIWLKGNSPFRKLEHISISHAKAFFYRQILIGDQADGVEGCYGVGPIKAAKLLDETTCLTQPVRAWEAIVQAFRERRDSIHADWDPQEEAIRQARLVRLLLPEDYDFDDGTIHLWNPPILTP